MLALEDLSAGYHNARGVVLRDVRLEVQAGAFVCILGRNGAGKSTLMRTIAGLQAALGGAARLQGEAINQMRPAVRARRVAVVLTERPASPGLRVDDVVALGRQPFTGWDGRMAPEDERIVEEALARAGASGFRGRYFDHLSDGERQRVMIARAIAQTPRLMVLDEITAFLDLPGRVEVMSLLRRHAHESGTVVLLSSHDLDLSLQLADSVWLLDGGGDLKVGPPGELTRAGHIGAAFDTAEITFAPELGRFQLRR
ncbi:MAG TPA: ABC transporter ATP-binding protein [Caulobacter sp.]|nr:ABC transporter ATP-binding protein [Caulobacter sp.]